MKKKLLVVFGIFVLLIALATAAFADKPIKLIVNGSIIETDVAPQLIDGRTMVPIRWVAEAIGAEVHWEEENRNVQIKTPQLDSLQQQVMLLQTVLAPKTPQEAVETWARGVKERNGALQYAVLSPELKQQKLSSYEGCRWVTGTSSPWVDRFEISKETQTGEGVWEYEVKFEYATSTGPEGQGVSKVVVKKYGYDKTLPSLDPNPIYYVSQFPGENKPNVEGPPKIIDEAKEVIPNKLIVTKTISDYAHGQHLVWVEGKFKHTEGELYLTFLGNDVRPLESRGLRKPDVVKPLDKEWSLFQHKLIEDTGEIVSIEKATITFGLGEKDRGFIDIPLKKPIITAP